MTTTRRPERAMGHERRIALTAPQRAVYDCIRESLRIAGYPPSRSEIASNLGYRTPNSIAVHINALVRKKYLQVTAEKARGLRLIEPDEVPLINLSKSTEDDTLMSVSCTAGHVPGILAERFDPRPECFIVIHEKSFRARAARVGDWLAVRTATEARVGDFVIARTRSAWICRRMRSTNKKLRIEGVVVGVLIARPA